MHTALAYFEAHGYAQIAENSGFKLSKQFGFQGRLTLDATEQLGYFDGKFAMLGFDAPGQESMASLNHWFVSSAYVNPDSIQIPVDVARIREEEPTMCNGLYYELAIDGGYFGSFLTPSTSKKDIDESAPIDGMLWYNADSLQFVITDTTNMIPDLSLMLAVSSTVTERPIWASTRLWPSSLSTATIPSILTIASLCRASMSLKHRLSTTSL